mgnify:CR=1 FL=1
MKSKYFNKSTIVSEDGEIVGKRTRTFYMPFKEGKGYNFKYKSTLTKSYLEIALPHSKKSDDDTFTDAEHIFKYKSTS